MKPQCFVVLDQVTWVFFDKAQAFYVMEWLLFSLYSFHYSIIHRLLFIQVFTPFSNISQFNISTLKTCDVLQLTVLRMKVLSLYPPLS